MENSSLVSTLTGVFNTVYNSGQVIDITNYNMNHFHVVLEGSLDKSKYVSVPVVFNGILYPRTIWTSNVQAVTPALLDMGMPGASIEQVKNDVAYRMGRKDGKEKATKMNHFLPWKKHHSILEESHKLPVDKVIVVTEYNNGKYHLENTPDEQTKLVPIPYIFDSRGVSILWTGSIDSVRPTLYEFGITDEATIEQGEILVSKSLQQKRAQHYLD